MTSDLDTQRASLVKEHAEDLARLKAEHETAIAEAQAALAATSDADLQNLADGENDLRGIPLPVLAVLKKYGVI